VNTKHIYKYLFFICAVVVVPQALLAQKTVKPAPLYIDKGKILYTPDSLGNRIPDFSYCGYMGGDKAIPVAPVMVVVPVKGGDATVRIQAALDYVASLPQIKTNIRGAVL